MTKKEEKNISNREVKNSAFTTFFGEPENASELYAALGDTEVSPEDITYVTLEGVPPDVRVFLVHSAYQGLSGGRMEPGRRNRPGGAGLPG